MRKQIALVIIATMMSLSAIAPAQDLTKLVSPSSDEARPRSVKKPDVLPMLCKVPVTRPNDTLIRSLS